MKATKQESISSRPRACAFATLLVVCLLCVFARTARGDAAEPTNPIAREHYTAGNRLYRVREFEKAIEEYKAGVLREDAAAFHYNLAQCYKQLGRHEEALWYYERFLQKGKPTGQRAELTRQLIDQMKEEIEKKAMKPIQPAAPPAVSASSGQPLPAGPPAEDHRGLTSQRKVAVGIGVAGVAVMGLGVGLGLRAKSFEDDAAEICPMDPCAGRSNEANKLIDRGKASARYGNIAFSVGGAAIVGAVVLWTTGSPVERKSTVFVPQVSRRAWGISASLRF